MDAKVLARHLDVDFNVEIVCSDEGIDWFWRNVLTGEEGAHSFETSYDALIAAAEEFRAKKRAHLEAKREANVKNWLKEGSLTKGTFLKVTGARDGDGIREFLEVSNDRLVCRQWTVVPDRMLKYHRGQMSKMKMLGEGMWVAREDQITTHDYNKVAEVFLVR